MLCAQCYTQTDKISDSVSVKLCHLKLKIHSDINYIIKLQPKLFCESWSAQSALLLVLPLLQLMLVAGVISIAVTSCESALVALAFAMMDAPCLIHSCSLQPRYAAFKKSLL